ncbi:HBL021Wp [Eremothecium sinecaudum]|uniref:Alkyl transferase n=1 Tax=Eremothecium sinecaudum TaxID=45286 RepID=A0A109UWJ2_9SACH|nr:HBL021Wp [Eremothecium sinecaudum]AMD18881.1 HBL021Wp [Eremothecium sinecaudum]
MEVAHEEISAMSEKEKVQRLQWNLNPLTAVTGATETPKPIQQHSKSSLHMMLSDLVHGQWKRHFQNEQVRITNLLLQIGIVRIILNFFQNLLLNILQMGPLPQHVSFIMDGNRRYARSLNLPLKRAHEEGSLTLFRTLHICKRVGIDVASAYAFSIENFNRPQEEIDTLTDMLSKRLQELANRANTLNDRLYGAKLFVVGDRSLLSEELNNKINYVESMTKHNTAFIVYICLPYTTRNDIYHSMYEVVKLCKDGVVNSKDITVELLNSAMYLGPSSNKADILVRTSGHTRLSDYMLWQTHENSVIEFSKCMWPDFTFQTFYLVLLKWSYFTTLQRARKRERLRSRVGAFAKFYLADKTVPAVSLESLPNPPAAISVTGK